MKKLFKVSTSLLTLLMTGAVATPSFAAVAGSKNTEGTVTINSSGTLSLIEAPNFDFGTVAVGSDMEGKNASKESVAVEDLRANGAGWNLTLRYGDSSGGTVEDEKAWNVTDTSIYGKGFEMNLPALVWDPTSVNEGTNVGKAPSVNNAVTVSKDESVVVSAAADPTGENAEGLGYWSGNFARNAAALKVPTNNIKGSYVSYLVWTLSDVPA